MDIEGAVLLEGDCLELLRTLDDCSVDAVVTDPPYGLRFMGRAWDYDVPVVEVWVDACACSSPEDRLTFSGPTRSGRRRGKRSMASGWPQRWTSPGSLRGWSGRPLLPLKLPPPRGQRHRSCSS